MREILEHCQGTEVISFSPGDILLSEGETTGLIYILISGCLEVTKGETPITRINQPGAIFGEISILLEAPHPASLEAVEPTTCHVIRGGKEYLLAHPAVALAVAELLASRVKGLVSYLADLKAQYADRKDHLCMVDEVLMNLAHRIPRK